MKINAPVYAAVTLCFFGCKEIKTELPNILWISCEDITPMLGCYGDSNASTPNLDKFAQRSVRYTNAFSTAPVCSPSRSCIVTGYYATSLGTQHLRSEVVIPEFIKPYPKFLREAGYFVTNNSKEDYNFEDTTIWDNSSKNAHWRERTGDQPFFSIFNFEITHQSSIFGDDSIYEKRIKRFLPYIKRCNPDSVRVPSYYPDSPITRKLWARYYTNVSIIDYQFSQVLKELEEDGLSDNTIVIFFSDHGTGMPRSKRAVYDSGLKVPLMVFFPAKYASEFNMKGLGGTTSDRLVSFIDFAPTMLEIAGIDIPSGWLGKPFLSRKKLQDNPFTFGASDRVDEAYELSRTIRTKEYRYIRNFLPHLPLLQPNYYTDQSEIMVELNRIKKEMPLTPAQATMFAPNRMPEELYDVNKDPDQVNNLAANPGYKGVLENMRKVLREEMMKTFDTGLMPEPEMIRLAASTTRFDMARNPSVLPVERILQACDLMLEESPSTDTLIKYLSDPNVFVRYWTLITIEAKGINSPEIINAMQNLHSGDFPVVRIEAAKILVQLGQQENLQTIIKFMNSDLDYLRLYACRAFQELSNIITNIPDPVYDIYKKLTIETDSGRITSKYYNRYTYWSLEEIFNK